MLKGWKACALYCAAALLIPALSFADNTESLGTPSIPFVDGTKTVAAGAGLEGHTGVIDLQIDDPIRQVVVYWSGAMGANIPGDDTIEIEGVEIVGTPISDPTFFFNCSGCGDNSGPFYFQSFRADITDFGLVQLGSNQLEVATSFERENSGAGIIVTTDNGLRTGTVIGRDGMDIAFEDFGGARKNTVPQDYHFGPSLTERQAVLTLMVGSVGSELGLGSIVRVTIDGVSTDHVDLLSSADGNFWDTQEIPVTIPAGADVVTVQLISTGGTRPAGMTWVSSTLFVPNATESLATADIAIANGSNFVAAGTGLFEQPGTIELDVPAGQIRQVLAYWSGAELSAIPGDETIEINGVSVTGDLIGDPAFFFDCVGCGDNSGPFHYSSFRADITDLGLVTNGLNTLSIHSDFGTDNSGATIVVIYDDGTENRALLLKDGLDLAFGGFEGLRSKTAPQTFVFDASEAERTADLLLLVGSVSNGGGTNTVEVTVNGETTSLSGLLTSADGRLWDTLRVPVSVEAGVEALTVQLVSGGASPEPLSWVAAGLSIGVESDANVDAFASSVAASPSVISRYRGVSTITATLVDGEGAPLPGLEVLFLANGADLDGMVVDHGDGTYSQNVIAQETATFAEVFARAEGVTVAEPAVITLIGVDPALSTVTVAPEEVYLDGIAVVTVTPKDSNGVEVGIGEIVELSTDLGTLIGDVIDNGDGTYSQMIQANGIGTASISAVVGGIELDGAATLTVLEMTEVGSIIGIEPSGETHAYCTIQQAINASRCTPIERIVVLPGTYNERLRLWGVDDLSVEGLTADGEVVVRGARVVCSDDVTLRNLDVHSYRTGVTVFGSERVTVENCRIETCGWWSSGVAIAISDDVTIAFSQIVDNFMGVWTWNVEGVLLKSNLISDNRVNGVRSNGNDGLTLTGNDFVDNGRHAIFRSRCGGKNPEKITLLNNSFLGNSGRVRPGYSDQNLNRFSRILDATDEQSEYQPD